MNISRTSRAERRDCSLSEATTYRLLLQRLELERRHDLSSLRLCVSAGEPLPAAVYEEWRRRTGIEILDVIGSTEMFHIFISARGGEIGRASCSERVHGYEAGVVDEHLEDVPRGTPGLLAVRGDDLPPAAPASGARAKARSEFAASLRQRR